jgi:hypothetical protein
MQRLSNEATEQLKNAPSAATPPTSPVYPTYGVHNPPEYSPCAAPDCLYGRGPGEPSDPILPLYWTAKWKMYRVYNQYAEYPPPYDCAPPPPLKEGVDYEVSNGASYYDSTWRGPNGEQGAMMEFYEDRALPIFPGSNHYSCAFISLGDNAYFLTFKENRPASMVPVCLFSALNHPPTRDFIKHLPYSKGDSNQLGGRVQGYSFWTSPDGKQPPIQVGVSPDRAKDGAVLFGYAFQSEWTEESGGEEPPARYRLPHSFYFSGGPQDPPNAPILSQNFYDFSITKPDSAKTWDLVAQFTEGKPIPVCQFST